MNPGAPQIVDNARGHTREILELVARYFPERPAAFLLLLAVGWCRIEGNHPAKILSVVRYALDLELSPFYKQLFAGLRSVRPNQPPPKGARREAGL